MQTFLQPTFFIDADHHSVRAYADWVTQGSRSDIQKAIRIYYAVRDGWRYNPYNITFEPAALKASHLLQREEGHCLDKATIMLALLRAVGVPARLRLAKVRNHIAAERMIATLGTDELTPHGYVEVWINGHWVKATPAFNKELCEKLSVAPLEFDGQNDSIFQPFDKAGEQFMEYLEEYGAFDDVPLNFIKENMRQHYPKFFEAGYLVLND